MAKRLLPLLLLLLCGCVKEPGRGVIFSAAPFTATGELTWQGRAYAASLCMGDDGILTVSVKNGLLASPVVFYAGEKEEGMRLGDLSLRLPAGNGAPRNVAACLRRALRSLEGVQSDKTGLWRGEGCSLSADEAGRWQTLTLSGGLLRFASVPAGP